MDIGELRNLISCPLCGEEFEKEEGMNKCLSCPISIQGCFLICCPRCGYSFPLESKLIRWLKKFLKKEERT